MTNDFNRENTELLWRSSIVIAQQRLLNFLNFMKTRSVMTNATLREF